MNLSADSFIRKFKGTLTISKGSTVAVLDGALAWAAHTVWLSTSFIAYKKSTWCNVWQFKPNQTDGLPKKTIYIYIYIKIIYILLWMSVQVDWARDATTASKGNQQALKQFCGKPSFVSKLHCLLLSQKCCANVAAHAALTSSSRR